MKNLLVLLFLPFLMFGQSRPTLKVGVKAEAPFVIKTVDGAYSGLSVDLWQAIVEELELNYEYVPYNDHLGLIRALDFGEVDLSINPIHVNELRLKVLDVTQPFFVSSIGVATTQVEKSQVALFISNFFSLDFLRIILMLVLVIFFFGTILWIAERRHNRRQFRPGLIGLFDGLWWSAVTMTTVGYGDKAPKSRAGRVVAMVWMFTAIIIISGFTATIASTLTVKSLSTEIEKIEDLENIEKIGTLYASSSEYFLNANDLAVYREYDNPESALKGLANKEVEVLLYDKTVLDYMITQLQLNNKVSLLPVNFNKQYRSFFLPKNSPYTKLINPLLVRNINEASWQDLLKKYNLKEE